MSNRSNKSIAKKHLDIRNFEALFEWADSVRNPIRILLSLVYDPDELIRWRAIEAIGKISKLNAAEDIEKTRDLIRRLFWLMNDESGGLSWHSPEIIAEILVNVPELIEEYSGLLLNYLYEEPFEIGSYWAVSRVASVNAKPFRDKTSLFLKSIENPDANIKIYSLKTLNYIDPELSRTEAVKLMNDNTYFRIYNFGDGQLVNTTCREMADTILNHSTDSIGQS